MKKNLILIGMPAVGKSTVGILLAKRLGLGFLDTDILIQTSENRTLAEIIAESGVKAFLGLEEKYLAGLGLSGHVVATGGSAVYSAAAMKNLARNGIVVYLEIGLNDLNKRLSALDSRGVVRAPGQSVESLYRERTPLYDAHADHTIPCGSLTPDQVMRRIVETLEQGGDKGDEPETDSPT